MTPLRLPASIEEQIVLGQCRLRTPAPVTVQRPSATDRALRVTGCLVIVDRLEEQLVAQRGCPGPLLPDSGQLFASDIELSSDALDCFERGDLNREYPLAGLQRPARHGRPGSQLLECGKIRAGTAEQSLGCTGPIVVNVRKLRPQCSAVLARLLQRQLEGRDPVTEQPDRAGERIKVQRPGDRVVQLARFRRQQQAEVFVGEHRPEALHCPNRSVQRSRSAPDRTAGSRR